MLKPKKAITLFYERGKNTLNSWDCKISIFLIFLFLVSVCFSATPALSASPISQEDRFETMNKAAEYLKEGQHQAAINVLTQLISDYPDWAEPYYSLALAEEYLTYNENPKWSISSRQNFEKFLKLAPKNDLRIGDVKERLKKIIKIERGYKYKDKKIAYSEGARDIKLWYIYDFPRTIPLELAINESWSGLMALEPDIRMGGHNFGIEIDFDISHTKSLELGTGLVLGMSLSSISFDPESPNGTAAINYLGVRDWGNLTLIHLDTNLETRWPHAFTLGSSLLRLYLSFDFRFGLGWGSPSPDFKTTGLHFSCTTHSFYCSPGIDIWLNPKLLLGMRIDIKLPSPFSLIFPELLPEFQLTVSNSNETRDSYNTQLPLVRLAVILTTRL